MSEPKTKGGAGLERLLTDMVRDGWFSGVDAGLDVVMARMDGETGLYNREHFESLVDDAIGDSLHGRERRASDGPEVGNVLAVRVRIGGPRCGNDGCRRDRHGLSGWARQERFVSMTSSDG